MTFIPPAWMTVILEDAEKRIAGAADYAERIGDPLEEVPAMRKLVTDIREQLDNQK